MKKDENSDVEMIIETGGEQQSLDVISQPEEALVQEKPVQEGKPQTEVSESARALQRIKESASEDDDAPVGSLSLKQIVGGDYLFALVRHHIVLILFIVFFLVFYIGVRYLEKELVDAKYKALSSSSNLTELCRQSNVLKVLRENQDTLLHLSDQPPYIIEVPED